MAFVEVSKFFYTYPGEDKPSLRNINLSIDSGAFVIITGKSGSGKSTLGKALAGFLFQDENPITTGHIKVNNANMRYLPLFEASEKVAYIQQNPEDQFCTLNVMDEIAFGLENLCFSPDEIECRIEEVLSIVKGLDLKKRDLSTLSGGEKQKIAIASMLALSPDVLILDEPTSNLDPMATKHVFNTLYHIRKSQDFTVIIIEHKLSQLLSFNPQLFEMDMGELQPIHNLQSFHNHNPGSKKVFQFEQKTPSISSNPIVSLSHMAVIKGEQAILDDINFTISEGEFISLMGPNGSGKSTLLETIMGFNEIHSGSCTTSKHGGTEGKTSVLVSDIGFIFQNPDHQLFTQSVWNEAILTSKNLETLTNEKEAKLLVWLTQMGLNNHIDKHPQRLSYGEKRRLNLIAAMLHEPQLLLIDELLIGQDIENAHTWMSVLKDYTQKGNAVLLVNHHADLTREYCDRLIFLNKGQIIVDNSITQAFNALESLGFSSFLPSTEWKALNA